jgi:hypothetical protein
VGRIRRRRVEAEPGRAGAATVYFVLLLELLLPLGEVVAEPLTLSDALPLVDGDVADGDVVVVSVDFDVELELVVVSDERGVDGDADGLVRSGTVPTRSVSVRLHATVIPPASARAQRPDSNFFIADDPPCGVWFRPSR